MAPLIESFEKASGIEVTVRCTAAPRRWPRSCSRRPTARRPTCTSRRTPGALQSLEDAGLFTALSQESLDKVDPAYRSGTGMWVGTSGRARAC